MKNITHYTMLAELFEYPGRLFGKHVSEIQLWLDANRPAAGNFLKPFSHYISQASPVEMEELFTRSFDVQAVTTLDLGYVVFGDDYKRGELLVNLNREHREAGNSCGTELADHLPNVLRLLPRMKDLSIRDELAGKVLAPALRKMIGEFDPEHIKAKDKVYKKHHKTILDRQDDHYTVYQVTLMALYDVLKSDFTFSEEDPKEATSDFLKSIHSEIEIEKE